VWRNEAALLAFYLKLLFTSSSNDLARGVLLFTPCKETERILLLRSDASEPLHSSALIQKNGRREGRGKEDKRVEKIGRNIMYLTWNTNCFY